MLEVRAEADAALARLATVDLAALPPDLRDMVAAQRRGWEEIRALTDADAVALHEAACKAAPPRGFCGPRLTATTPAAPSCSGRDRAVDGEHRLSPLLDTPG